MGAVFLTVLLTRIAADWFAGREVAVAMAILITGWPVGIALGLVSFGTLAERTSWPSVMIATAIAAIAALIVVAVAYRPAPGAPASAPQRSLRPELAAREWLLVSLAGLVWAALQRDLHRARQLRAQPARARGYSLSSAGLVASLAGRLLIPTSPAGGYLVERLKRAAVVMLGSFVVSAAAMLGLPATAAPALVLAIVAIAFGPAAGIIMTVPTEAVRPGCARPASASTTLWYYLDVALLPRVAGMTRDVTGTPVAPIVFATAMLGVAAVALAAFRYIQRSCGSPPAAALSDTQRAPPA